MMEQAMVTPIARYRFILGYRRYGNRAVIIPRAKSPRQLNNENILGTSSWLRGNSIWNCNSLKTNRVNPGVS